MLGSLRRTSSRGGKERWGGWKKEQAREGMMCCREECCGGTYIEEGGEGAVSVYMMKNLFNIIQRKDN